MLKPLHHGAANISDAKSLAIDALAVNLLHAGR
jgi:hypothetical protein